MTVSTPLVVCPIAPTPLVVHPVAPTDVSHPHIASRLEQVNGSYRSSATPLRSHSTAHVTSTHPLVARPIAPMHVSPSHVASHPERTNGTSISSSTPLLSHPTAISSRFHGVSHEPHPCIAPRFVRSRTPLAPSLTLPTSHSNVDISHAVLSSPHHVASHVSYPCVPPRSVRPCASSASSHTCPHSHSILDTSPSTSTPRKKRSRRCFVCGGTGKHRLNPRFCPRTYELLSKRLVKFDANFRLVSDDGSPLPMTRHPGGVAAHLLSPRRLPPRTICVSPRSVLKSPDGSHSNPPHVPHAHRDPPVHVPRPIPGAVPESNLNPPHAPLAVVEHPHRISIPDRRFESNPPHLPREERSSSPPFRILTPIHESLPRSETPSKSRRYPDNAFILLLLDCLTLSPSWRRELAGLNDAITCLNLDNDIPALQKLMEPVRERYKTFVPSI